MQNGRYRSERGYSGLGGLSSNDFCSLILACTYRLHICQIGVIQSWLESLYMKANVLLLLAIYAVIIMITGGGIKDNLIEGASVKNLLLYGVLLWYLRPLISGSNRVPRQIRKVQRIYLILALWIIGSSLFAAGRGGEFTSAFDTVKIFKTDIFDPLVMLLIIPFLIRSQRSAFFALRMLLLGTALLGALTVVEAFVPSLHFFGVDAETPNRQNGPFGEPNQSSVILAMLLVMSVALAFRKDTFRTVYILASVALLAAIFVTGSRGGLVAVAFGGMWFVALARRQLALSTKILVAFTIPLVGIIAWAVLPGEFQQMMLDRILKVTESDGDLYTASSGRTWIWGAAIEIWWQQPFLGVGWSSFRQMFHGASHNEYLRYLAETGLVGLLMYVALWWQTIKSFSCGKDVSNDVLVTYAGAQGSMAALLLGIFFVNLYVPWIAVWCILGVLMSYFDWVRIRQFRDGDRNESTRIGVTDVYRRTTLTDPTASG